MAETNTKKLAVVRVRGQVGVKHDIKRGLEQLRLGKKHTCVVVDDTPANRGILQLIKDYVTWGEVDDKVFADLVAKRGREYKARTHDKKEKITYARFMEVNGKKIYKTFTLNSPRKGWERAGIKSAFNSGGALGYRGEKVNDLLTRMM